MEEQKKEKVVEIYTDGSCITNPGKGGWSYVLPTGGYKTGSKEFTTNNEMELEAIRQAIIDHKSQTIIIYSDSQYAINCVTIWCKKWKQNGWVRGKKLKTQIKNLELIKEISSLVESSCCKLKWVRGHSGNKFNELADQLANIAALS